MDLNYFKTTKILDGGMGQELLANGLISKGTLWSTSAVLEEKYHQLLIDVHLSFINAGADVIVTNNFSSRRIRLIQNKVEKKFNYVNQKACELANKAREVSKKNILIAGSLPPQNGTYVVDERDIDIIKKDFKDQAEIIRPYVDFFYLDVITSAKEIEAACEITEKMNMPILVGLHLKKNGLVFQSQVAYLIPIFGVILGFLFLDWINWCMCFIRNYRELCERTIEFKYTFWI